VQQLALCIIKQQSLINAGLGTSFSIERFFRSQIKSASKYQLDPLSNQRCLSQAKVSNNNTPCGEFVDCRIKLIFTAFLFAALIFFVSFFYQEKKENRSLLNNVKPLRIKPQIL
jgi:hypothetical protein